MLARAERASGRVSLVMCCPERLAPTAWYPICDGGAFPDHHFWNGTRHRRLWRYRERNFLPPETFSVVDPLQQGIPRTGGSYATTVLMHDSPCGDSAGSPVPDRPH